MRWLPSHVLVLTAADYVYRYLCLLLALLPCVRIQYGLQRSAHTTTIKFSIVVVTNLSATGFRGRALSCLSHFREPLSLPCTPGASQTWPSILALPKPRPLLSISCRYSNSSVGNRWLSASYHSPVLHLSQILFPFLLSLHPSSID